ASPDIDGTATKRKLYALLVGINEYQGDVVLQDSVTFPALSGCVPDMKKVKKYLQQDEAFDADVVLLTDEQATKENVVRQFREHLGRAGSEDVALFFYSGHGTQEYADRSIWTSDTDGRLECLACYFTEETKNDFLLADKELRFLIHELSQKNPHIVALFDCCHSADNTRNGALVQHHFKNITEKRLPFVFAQRSWEQFLFSGTIDSADIMAKGEAAMLPEGRHIQFAASESNESAVEVDGTGVFTQAMLKVLKDSGGDITYQTLASRIRQYLKSVYEQKPRVYVANGSGTLLHQPFLNRPASASRHAFGEIVYNEHLGWLLGLGAIHGMNRSVKTLEVFDPAKPDVIYSAKRGTIRTDTTEITPGRELDTKKIYQARIEGLMSHTLRLHVAVSNADPHDQQAILDALAEWPQQFELQELETDAQYVLRHANGRFYITRPADPFRPLVKPVDCSEEDCIALLVGQLRHISSWEFACRLVNEEQDNIPADAVTIEVTVGSQRFLLDEQDVIPVTYSKVNGSWENAVHIRITNNTKKDIYCSALYLPSDFRAYAGFLNPPVYLLEKENTVELKYDGSAPIPVYFDKRLMWYNWKEVTDRMKFLFSTEVFDVSALLLDELPGPVIPTDPDTRSIAERGLLPPTDSARKRVSGWFTRDLQLQLQNPEYNQVREDELEQMLADERTADFALGLYLSGEVDEGLEAGYRLKEGIVLVPSADGRKGFVQDRVIDLANFFARSQRNRLYRRTLSRFPGRTRIVAEGDSWFQHPLVFDIIDHLSRSYAVFCSAAAGDTLRNYFSGKNRNGEYYLDAIESEDPAFFLISGGGNDILGKQFRGYLTDFPDDDEPEGTNPRRFLKQSLFDEIDSLMEIYRTLFSKLETLKPGLRILVHGYDYPVKLDDAKKGWLGRYMIEKGIYRPGDRRAVIRLILDDFNQKLAAATAGFSNVSYLDVRNIVRYTPETGIDQWYDEIHPTNDGYQMVAMKFMQKIDALTRQPHVKKPEAALDSLTE
ncbi:MAG TPA: caspase family protein, partial [Flavisolibacter sp.]